VLALYKVTLPAENFGLQEVYISSFKKTTKAGIFLLLLNVEK
jgi:hypothetical protein